MGIIKRIKRAIKKSRFIKAVKGANQAVANLDKDMNEFGLGRRN